MVLSAVTLTACHAGQVKSTQLVYGRDWKYPEPTAIEADPPPATSTPGELDSQELTVAVETATPPATPTPAAQTYSPPPLGFTESLGEEQLRQVLREAGWPEELHEQAMRVAWCESRWHPDSVNGQSGVTGLFQLWEGWYRYSGLNRDDWADPIVNARAAYGAFLYSGGWNQWQCQP